MKISNGVKIAISSMEKNINGNVADVFGRCSYFIVTQVEQGKIGEIEVIENNNVNQNSGAGVSTAQLIAEQKIDVVITKNMGPRAIDVLTQFKIEVYSGEGIIKEVLEKFINKKLKKIN